MNWKVIALLPALVLTTALPGYSLTKVKNHTSNTATHVAQTQPTTKPSTQPTSTKKPATQTSNTSKKVNPVQKPQAKRKSSTNAAKRTTVLTVGSRGDAVKNAQNLLKQQGFYAGNVNGVFDNNTRAAVIKFQKSKGLRADGIIGARTLAALK